MFRQQLDLAARALAEGVSRRTALRGILSGTLMALLQPGSAMAAQFGLSCFDDCKRKCTQADGSLDLDCFRNCVNSDPLNCGRCGNVCSSGQCVAGHCVSGPDLPTAESLRDALFALGSGASEVALTPGGTVRFRQTINNGVLVQDEIVRNGYTTMLTRYSDGLPTDYHDANRDGLFERIFTVSGNPKNFVIKDEYFSATSGQVIKRVTEAYLADASALEITVEQVDVSGTLQRQRHYFASNGALTALSDPSFTTGGPCSPDQCDPLALLSQMLDAAAAGVSCLERYSAFDGGSDVADRVYRYAMRSFASSGGTYNLQCDPGLPSNVLARTYQAWGPYPTTTYVNQNTFCAGNETPAMTLNRQRAVLFHELIHAMGAPPEDPALENEWVPRQEEFQTYACMKLCFYPDDANRCVCRTCLQTNFCDKGCESFGPCQYQNSGSDPDICSGNRACANQLSPFRPTSGIPQTDVNPCAPGWHCESTGKCVWDCADPGQVVQNGICTFDPCAAGGHYCPGSYNMGGCCTSEEAVCVLFGDAGNPACCVPGAAGKPDACELYNLPAICCG